jgi:hypothetical protein
VKRPTLLAPLERSRGRVPSGRSRTSSIRVQLDTHRRVVQDPLAEVDPGCRAAGVDPGCRAAGVAAHDLARVLRLRERHARLT